MWFDILNDDAKAGEIRLQQHRKNWVLHVSVEYPIEEPSADGDTTPIGLDIGETALITACGLKRGTPTRPVLWSGKRAKHLRKEMSTTLQRLQERDAEWRIDERFDYYQNALTAIIEKASREVVDYAATFENPQIVMEDLTYIRERLDYGKFNEPATSRLGLRAATGARRGQSDGRWYPGRIRQSGLQKSDVPRVRPPREAGFASGVPVYERGVSRFDVSGGYQCGRKHR